MEAKSSTNLSHFSTEFRRFFLLNFTRELIKNSAEEISELKRILKKQKYKKRLPEFIEKEVKTETQEFPIVQEVFKFPKEEKPEIKIQPKKSLIKHVKRVLRIPEPKLPLRLQYLRPVFADVKIDIGKLNPLIADPNVRTIECNGSEENLVVTGLMGVKRTRIILNSLEIEEVMNKFSEKAKIPIEEGITKIVVGRLILLAITSKVISSKFIIRKMSLPGRYRLIGEIPRKI